MKIFSGKLRRRNKLKVQISTQEVLVIVKRKRLKMQLPQRKTWLQEKEMFIRMKPLHNLLLEKQKL